MSPHVVGDVVVLKVAGRLSDVAQELDWGIRLALADGPRGVVCDLSGVFEGAEPDALQVLATTARHVRDWPGSPVAVATPDPHVRDALDASLLGKHLIVTATVPSAMFAVRSIPAPNLELLRLAPHPTAPRAARYFVTCTLLDWGLGTLIPSACMVVSELVTNSAMHVGTDLDLSIAWGQGGLRLTVRDSSPSLGPRMHQEQRGLLTTHGRGLSIVTGLTRGFGVLPTTDGGKVVWAVLDAPATPCEQPTTD